jgi:hypothetical protein
MNRTNRKFSSEERLAILQEAEREGNAATTRKYNLSPTLLGKWKERYTEKGLEGLKPAYKRIDPELRRLEDENNRLKKIIANQALQIEVQGELLKKTPISPRIK